MIEEREFVVYKTKNEDIIIKSLSDIAKFVSKNTLMIYIHNINFDGPLLINSLSSNNIFFDSFIRNLDIYSIKFEYLGIEFTFKCSYKIIPISLKNIVDLTYKKKPFPYKFINEKNLNYLGPCPDLCFFESKEDYYAFKDNFFDLKKETIDYCLNDVYLLRNVLKDFILTLEKINKKYYYFIMNSLSVPSFSNKIFYKFFNIFNIEKKISLEMNSYIEKSYFGGRCEIFGNILDGEIIHYFDYSGMYGQCMMEKFPIGSPYFKTKVDNFKESGFYYILYISDSNIPVLPYKSKKLLFPNGTLEGIYWYEEINEFIKNGGKVLEIKYAILYHNEDYVFKEFVDSFNNIKKKGGYYKIIGKLIINSLYGSFGMKLEDNFTIITFSEYEFNEILLSTNVISYFKINNCYVIKINKDYKSKIIYNKNKKKWDEYYHERNVAYSSIISSKARIKLYKSFKDVEDDGGRLLYCDTDSIFASYNNSKLNLKCGKDIIWSNLYEDGLFILPKTYILKNKQEEIIKFKGINKSDIDYNYLKNEFTKDMIKFENQLIFYKKNMILKQKFIEKNVLFRKYDKRIFFNNMKYTKPIYILPH